MINGNQPREKPPIDYWKFMQQIYDMGSNFDRLSDLACVQGWVESSQLQAAREDFNNLILQITDAMIMPERMDVREVLKRGKLVTEQDI